MRGQPIYCTKCGQRVDGEILNYLESDKQYVPIARIGIGVIICEQCTEKEKINGNQYKNRNL